MSRIIWCIVLVVCLRGIESVTQTVDLSMNANAGNLCAFCNCYPNYSYPLDVACKSRKSILRLNGGYLTNMPMTRSIRFFNYQLLTFERNAFQSTQNLHLIEIGFTAQAILPDTVFTHIETLIMRNVSDLYILSNAFLHNDHLETLQLTNVHLVEIPTRAIFNVTNLSRVRLTNVTIGDVAEHAFNIDASRGYIDVNGLKIARIQTNGFVVRNFHSALFNRLTFDTLDTHALMFDHVRNITVTNSYFTALKQSAISVANVTQIQWVNNTFEMIDAFEWNDTRVSMRGNVFKDVDLIGVIRASLYNASGNVTGNQFVCKCVTDEWLTVLREDALENEAVLKGNFCRGNCSMTLLDYVCRSANACVDGAFVDEVFCARSKNGTLTDRCAGMRPSEHTVTDRNGAAVGRRIWPVLAVLVSVGVVTL